MNDSTNRCSCYVYCSYKCSRGPVHLIVSLSISCPYLIKFHYFADSSEEGMKHQMKGFYTGPTDNSFLRHENYNFFSDMTYACDKIFVDLRLNLFKDKDLKFKEPYHRGIFLKKEKSHCSC